MKPTVGRIIHYVVTEADRAHVDALRAEGIVHLNPLSTQQHLPAIVIVPWSEETVNAQVLLDGATVLWKTSIKHGTVPGTWHWPEREE